MMNAAAADHIAEIVVIDTIAYELHKNGRVRIFDTEAEEVVAFVMAATFDAGVVAYRALVAKARKLAGE